MNKTLEMRILCLLAVPTGGPPMGRIDLGCIREDGGPERLWYPPGSAALIDQGFGVFDPGAGPCATSDPAFEDLMAEASVVAEGGDYRYPRTAVWFLFGTRDRSNAVPQGLVYFQRLARGLTPLLHLEFLPGVPHGVHKSPRGAERITDVILAECREH